MPMIQLYSQPVTCNEFRVNTSEYFSNPSPLIQAQIQYFEEAILERSNDFLSDPQAMICKWEELTGEEMPEKYTEGLPQEISNFIRHVRSRQIAGYELNYLPVVNQAGQSIDYSEDRLVSDFLKSNMKVYVLREAVAKELGVAC
jgi:hypothetical protein